MANVMKKNLIIIKSIIVWKWNHLFAKNYFRKKKINYCYGFMRSNFQVICGSMVGKNYWLPASTEIRKTSHKELFLLPKFDNTASVTRKKEICQRRWVTNISTSWSRVPNRTPSMRFTCYPNLIFLASWSLEIYRFSNWSFCWLWEVWNC